MPSLIFPRNHVFNCLNHSFVKSEIFSRYVCSKKKKKPIPIGIRSLVFTDAENFPNNLVYYYRTLFERCAVHSLPERYFTYYNIKSRLSETHPDKNLFYLNLDCSFLLSLLFRLLSKKTIRVCLFSNTKPRS